MFFFSNTIFQFIFSNPRSSQSPRSNGGGNQAPVQSRSFNILQQITEGGAQEVGPHYSRQISGDDLKRLQITDQRMKTPGNESIIFKLETINYKFIFLAGMNQRYMPEDPSLPPSEQQVKEPNLYQGSSIPSRSFRILQNAMNAAENAGTNFY